MSSASNVLESDILCLYATLELFVISNFTTALSPGVMPESTSLPLSSMTAVPLFSKVPFSVVALPFVYVVTSLASADTSTLPLVTAMLTFDSLVKSAIVAPAIRLEHIIIPSADPRINFFFIYCLLYRFFTFKPFSALHRPADRTKQNSPARHCCCLR